MSARLVTPQARKLSAGREAGIDRRMKYVAVSSVGTSAESSVEALTHPRTHAALSRALRRDSSRRLALRLLLSVLATTETRVLRCGKRVKSSPSPMPEAAA